MVNFAHNHLVRNTLNDGYVDLPVLNVEFELGNVRGEYSEFCTLFRLHLVFDESIRHDWDL